jgi:hypothetical protein
MNIIVQTRQLGEDPDSREPGGDHRPPHQPREGDQAHARQLSGGTSTLILCILSRKILTEE